MKFTDSLKTAIVGLKTNKTRSALTILGIVIGIAAVIIMMSIGSGAQNLILSQIEGLGSNLIIVMPGGMKEEKGSPPRMSMGMMTIKTLTYEDSQALLKKSNAPYVKNVAPIATGEVVVVYKSEDRDTNFIGTTPEIQYVTDNYPVEGRLFTDQEVKSVAKVVVLGSKVKEKLFNDQNPLGEFIKIQRINFRVIGVMAEKGARGMEDPDDQVFVPLTTAQTQLLGIEHLQAIMVQAENEKVIDQTVEDIKTTLRERHHITDPSKDDFMVKSQLEFTETLGMITSILTIFLTSVAAIALVVGGIGIMNIMLVSVTERTREIGLRKAVGARKKDILLQFLIEAVTLTILGGMLGIISGIIFSYIGGLVLEKVLGIGWSFSLSLVSIVLAFGVATTIGLIFGIYPARKAAQLSPIEALRYE